MTQATLPAVLRLSTDYTSCMTYVLAAKACLFGEILSLRLPKQSLGDQFASLSSQIFSLRPSPPKLAPNPVLRP